jgi:hypothetical protein
MALALGWLVVPAWGQGAAPPAGVEPRADEIFRRMSAYLGASRQIQFEAQDMNDEILDTGQKIQFSSVRRIAVRRPDKLYARILGDTMDERVLYDGKMMTILDQRAKVYGTLAVPDNVEEMLDYVAGYFGVAMPLADLVFTDVYGAVIDQVRQGRYVGLHTVQGVKCHHLAFRQADLDWQIWIADGDKPVPRKLVITYKSAPGQPQYIALLGKWDLSTPLADSVFELEMPEGAKKIDLKPASERPNGGQPEEGKPGPEGP